MTDYEKKLDELSTLIAVALEKDGINSMLVEAIKQLEFELEKVDEESK